MAVAMTTVFNTQVDGPPVHALNPPPNAQSILDNKIGISNLPP